MRGWVAVTLLCACNQVFDLRKTVPWDGAQPDAPFACPAAGTAPQFTQLLYQINAQDCTDYTLSSSAGLATALCTDGSRQANYIAQGPIDGELAASVGIPSDESLVISQPRLSPEGDELYVPTFDLTNTVFAVEVFQVQPDGSWVRGADLALPAQGVFSGPTSAPNRHILRAIDSSTDSDLHELVDDGTNTWTEVLVHTAASLGITQFAGMSLSADGLRLTFYASAIATPNMPQTWYADRAALGDLFSNAVPLTVPPTGDAFMTADCSRVYLSGLQSIFYMQQ